MNLQKLDADYQSPVAQKRQPVNLPLNDAQKAVSAAATVYGHTIDAKPNRQA